VGNKGRYDLAWQIRTLRCLWADLDGCTPEQAVQRCAAQNMPDPTAIVSSGNGVHLYWLLNQPFLIDDVGDPPPVEAEWLVGPDGKRKAKRYITDGKERIYIDQRHHLTRISPKAQHVQDILAGIAQAVGGDHATDLTRLLRLPGTLNRKDERNGKSPIPSELVVIEPSRRYAIVDFDRFAKPVKAPSCERLPEPEAEVLNTSECGSHVLSDDEIINLACKQRQSGPKFQALWSGDWTSHFNSPSEADSSVVFTLAYYTKDAQQIDRLFRQSKLMRPKWDERHGSESYGQTTIAKALSKVTN